MKLAVWTLPYLNIKCWKCDQDRFSSFWDMARQSQKSGGAFIQTGVFIWRNMVYLAGTDYHRFNMAVKPIPQTTCDMICSCFSKCCRGTQAGQYTKSFCPGAKIMHFAAKLMKWEINMEKMYFHHVNMLVLVESARWPWNWWCKNPIFCTT